jgi:hypothetical protein
MGHTYQAGLCLACGCWVGDGPFYCPGSQGQARLIPDAEGEVIAVGWWTKDRWVGADEDTSRTTNEPVAREAQMMEMRRRQMEDMLNQQAQPWPPAPPRKLRLLPLLEATLRSFQPKRNP